MNRGQACAVIAGGAAGAWSDPASAQDLLHMRIGAFPAEVCAELFYAKRHGAFAAAGIAADVSMLSNGAAIIAGIGGRALDVGIADLVSVISAHAHGLPIVYLAPGLAWSVDAPTVLPVVAADSAIRLPLDFSGKVVAVNGLNNIAQIPFMVWLDRNGGDSRAVKFVELPLPAMLPALARARIDAMVCPEPFVTLAVQAGNRTVLPDGNVVARSYLLSGYVASREWIARNRGVARRFVAVVRAAGAWANAHPDAAAPILAEATQIPLPVVRSMRRGRFRERLDPSAIQPVIDAAAAYGVIPRPILAADLIGAL